jgi:long-chain acyl-CoA synthetase
MNFVQLFDRPIAEAADRPALIVDDQRYSYGQLGRAIERVAAHLAARGVSAGSRVPLLDDSGLLLLAAVLGAARLEAAAVPLHTQLTPGELAKVCGICGCEKVGVAGDPYASKLDEALGTPALRAADLIDAAPPSPAPAPAGGGEREGVVLLTSGTTGLPKPVGMSHESLISRVGPYAGAFDPASPADCMLTCAPGVHVGGLVGMFVGLVSGGTVVIQRRFEAGRWLHLVEQHRVTTTFLVPTMIRRILDHPDFDRTDLSSFKIINYGAAAAPVELVEEMVRRFPKGCGFANLYGQTETTGSISVLGPEDHVLDADGHLPRPGSVGPPMPGVEVELRNTATGEPVPEGEPGELWTRSMYNAQAGWRQTGDLVRQDADGYLYPLGRLSDTINRGGEKFGPSEIEEVLRLHPSVRDAAVAGVPDPEMGERVGAAVVLRSEVSADALRAHCREHLARFKTPERIAFVEEIPPTAMWKVSRKTIAELIERNAPADA